MEKNDEEWDEFEDFDDFEEAEIKEEKKPEINVDKKAKLFCDFNLQDEYLILKNIDRKIFFSEYLKNDFEINDIENNFIEFENKDLVDNLKQLNLFKKITGKSK